MSVHEDTTANGISFHGSRFQVKQRLWSIQSLNYLMGTRARESLTFLPEGAVTMDADTN